MATGCCWNAGCSRDDAADTYERNRSFRFDPVESLDAVILSHAHIDHCGNLPNLVKQGYRGPIYATPATAHLADIMLLDSGHIQEADAAFINKKRTQRGEPPVEAAVHDGGRSAGVAALRAARLQRDVRAGPGGDGAPGGCGAYPGLGGGGAGYRGEGAQVPAVVLGRYRAAKLPLLRDPVLPEGADYLMMECTYGDKPHRDPEAAYDELRDVVKRTIERGGKVIIPAFAVGRTQELVYNLHQMIEGRRDPATAGIRGQPAGGERDGRVQDAHGVLR